MQKVQAPSLCVVLRMLQGATTFLQNDAASYVVLSKTHRTCFFANMHDLLMVQD